MHISSACRGGGAGGAVQSSEGVGGIAASQPMKGRHASANGGTPPRGLTIPQVKKKAR